MKATENYLLSKEDVTTEFVETIMSLYPNIKINKAWKPLFAVFEYISRINDNNEFFLPNTKAMEISHTTKPTFNAAIAAFTSYGWLERTSGYRITGDRKASLYKFLLKPQIEGVSEGVSFENVGVSEGVSSTIEGVSFENVGVSEGVSFENVGVSSTIEGVSITSNDGVSFENVGVSEGVSFENVGVSSRGKFVENTEKLPPYTYTDTYTESDKEKESSVLSTLRAMLEEEKEKNKKEIEMLRAVITEQAQMIANLNARIDKSANLFTSMRQEIDNLRASVQGRGGFSKKEDSFISSSFQSQSDGARINEIITSMENDEVRQKDLKYILAQRDERKIPHTLYAPFMAALGKLQSKYANWFVDGASDFFDANINRVVAETDLTGISTEDEDAILRVLGEILKPFSVRCNTVYIILNGRENRDKVSEYLQQYYARTYDMIIKRVASPKNVEEGVATEKDLTLCYTDEPF